jgi:hypothetical protein
MLLEIMCDVLDLPPVVGHKVKFAYRKYRCLKAILDTVTVRRHERQYLGMYSMCPLGHQVENICESCPCHKYKDTCAFGYP